MNSPSQVDHTKQSMLKYFRVECQDKWDPWAASVKGKETTNGKTSTMRTVMMAKYLFGFKMRVFVSTTNDIPTSFTLIDTFYLF